MLPLRTFTAHENLKLIVLIFKTINHTPIVDFKDFISPRWGHPTVFELDALSMYVGSHFYFDIKFGFRLYSKQKRRAWPLLF
jgi:hypothetical protein